MNRTSFDRIAPNLQALSAAALGIGSMATLAGIFGIWLQGEFYGVGVGWYQATQEEVALAFILPCAVTVFGCLMIAPVILCSPIGAKWSVKRRATVYLLFAATVLALCTIAGLVAAAKVGRILV
jgi:hypothetical protein